VGLVVAIGGGAWVTRKAFVSLDEVVRTAAVLGADNFHARVPSFAGAGAEVEQVAAALNGMLERLERAVLGLRRFTANAAHELRTPLTVLLGNLEISLRRPHDPQAVRATMEETHEELERMVQLVESLLTLARSDASELPISAVSLDAGEVVSQVVGLYETVASERGLQLSLHSPQHLPVRTDPLWLSRIVVNLVDNACKFTEAGGRVDLQVQPAHGGVLIAVEDTGPGVAEPDRARIFERFFRGAGGCSSHAGFGLGLSLAHDLAGALGGSLLLERRADGQAGARFVLQVPDQPR
jgi:signal transduction histidine kinase